MCMAQVAALSPTVQDKLAKLATLLEQAGRLAREMSLAQPEFTPVAGRPRPAKVPKSQAWFWTKEWQAGEREVDEEIARGAYKEFDSVEKLLADLHAQV
jgi:hypothetical protein